MVRSSGQSRREGKVTAASGMSVKGKTGAAVRQGATLDQPVAHFVNEVSVGGQLKVI